MRFLFVLLTITSFSVNAQNINSVNNGEQIKASQINTLIDKVNLLSSQVETLKKEQLPVGTIIQSVLSESQYQLENGNCWKLANGANLLVTDDLRIITGETKIPDTITQGAFLRQAKAGRALGTLEDDSFKSHNHAIVSPPDISFRGGAGGTGFVPGGSFNGPNGPATVGFSGGDETRPKNVSVNMFIKFKKACSF